MTGRRVLDVGAHWLHQAVLWRRAGHKVTAVDLPETLEFDGVQRLATAEGITLVVNSSLEDCAGLETLPESSFDVVLFTEIIEHLAINPVAMWRQIHRVLAPGGRIVVTTPNYYAWNGRAWSVGRFLTGMGGGISVDQVLTTPTLGHHWREYARRELKRYFGLISPDFRVENGANLRDWYLRHPGPLRRTVGRVLECLPGLRPQIYLEVHLVGKAHGVVLSPRW
ncbi:MAG: class I SAM-dependent methyltransferase [Xanthomonadales bacterium]|nr:class I SAM-dependent methyltransferase [Xanthomonadales bacterium]